MHDAARVSLHGNLPLETNPGARRTLGYGAGPRRRARGAPGRGGRAAERPAPRAPRPGTRAPGTAQGGARKRASRTPRCPEGGSGRTPAAAFAHLVELHQAAVEAKDAVEAAKLLTALCQSAVKGAADAWTPSR